MKPGILMGCTLLARECAQNPISAGSYADNVRSETNATFNELAGEQREAGNDNIVVLSITVTTVVDHALRALDRKNRRELQSLIIKLSDITEPIAATEQIACHTGRILSSGMSTRMVFATHYRTHNRCNVRPIGIVAVEIRGVEICFNAQPALVDGAGPLKVFSSAYTRGVPDAPYSRQFVTAYIGSPNAAKRKVFDKRVRRREGRPRRSNKRARPDITVAADASGYSFT
ncbi:hypothetical protein G5I_14598 [Acromyrmex echinatior]|uniref:Uncharacterized protein n=1 Tax=Acromyrmex echinatior TaxID=103372 RepID=F4X859_ACREC|nr:hypothetical protein G5I_14598 [Acromyrmex echinatior]